MFKLLIIFVTSVIFCSSQGIAKDDLDNQLDELKTHYFVGIWVSDAGRIEIKIVDRINDYEIKKYPAKNTLMMLHSIK